MMILYINVYMIHMIYELMLHYPLTFLTFQVCARQLAPLRLIAPDVSGHGCWDHEFAPFWFRIPPNKESMASFTNSWAAMTIRWSKVVIHVLAENRYG